MIIRDWDKAAKFLVEGKIGIIPTDTIYGISCIALNRDLVEKIYKIKGRVTNKPFIILISSLDDLYKFSIKLGSNEVKIVEKCWPGPVSIVLDVTQIGFEYLHRGGKTLAFRLPKYRELTELLTKTGPIVSTSANISDNSTVTSINDAVKVFQDQVDFYLDAGQVINTPSKVIKIVNGEEIVLRS